MTHFYDAADWTHIPHDSDAALYHDGAFAAPDGAAAELDLRHVRYITVTGDARNCSIVDYEKLNPVYFPAGLRAFVRGRRELSMDAIVYCNRETAAGAIAALRDFGNGDLLQYERLFWWIATLDNIELTAQELCAQLATQYNAPEITTANLWANQYGQINGGTVDISNRFLSWQP